MVALTPFKVVRVNGFYRVGKCNYSLYWTVSVTLLGKEEQEMENPNNFPSLCSLAQMEAETKQRETYEQRKILTKVLRVSQFHANH